MTPTQSQACIDILTEELQQQKLISGRLSLENKCLESELSDTKIAEKFSVCEESIRNWRINRKLPPIAKKKAGLGNLKFSTIIQSEFEELYYQGMNDPKIAKILGVSPYTMFRYRTTLGLPTVDRYRRIELTNFQYQVLIGHLILINYSLIQ